MADERTAASKTEPKRKIEGSHNALSFTPIFVVGPFAKQDPYNNSTLYMRLMLLARANRNFTLVINPMQTNARSGTATQSVCARSLRTGPFTALKLY